MNDSQKFISVVIASGLDFETITPDDVFRHVTMQSLAKSLPVELMAMLLEAALASKTMTATLVLDTLGVDALAEHLPASLLWACVSDAALRALGTQSPRVSTVPTQKRSRTSKVASAPKKASAGAAQAAKSQRRNTVANTPATTPASRARGAESKVAQKVVATVPRKPNRSASALFSPELAAPAVVEPAALPVEAMDHLTPKDGLEGRMKTISDSEGGDTDSYDEETNVGFDAVNSETDHKGADHKEAEQKEEVNPYSADGNEVTAFGPDS